MLQESLKHNRSVLTSVTRSVLTRHVWKYVLINECTQVFLFKPIFIHVLMVINVYDINRVSIYLQYYDMYEICKICYGLISSIPNFHPKDSNSNPNFFL